MKFLSVKPAVGPQACLAHVFSLQYWLSRPPDLIVRRICVNAPAAGSDTNPPVRKNSENSGNSENHYFRKQKTVKATKIGNLINLFFL